MKNKIDMLNISKSFESLSKRALNDMNITTSKRILNEWSGLLNNEFIITKNNLRVMQKSSSVRSPQKEYDLDTLLFIQCLLGALKSFYSVLIFLKIDENHKSWESLVGARDYLKVAESYIDKYEVSRKKTKPSVDALLSIHHDWEKVFFPSGFIYVSAGLKESIGDCSVCRENFMNCEHIEGYIYSGKYCQRINRKVIEADHIALVKSPRDKRCIITTRHDEEGFQIDFFSRERIIGKDKPEPDLYETTFLHINAIDL